MVACLARKYEHDRRVGGRRCRKVVRRRRDRGFRFIKTYSSRCRRPHIGSQRPSCLRRRRAIVRSAAGSPEGYLPRYCDLGHLKVTWRPRLTTLALVLTGFSRRLVSDHGSAVVHRHLARASYHAVSLSQLADHGVENPGTSDVPLSGKRHRTGS